MGTASAFVYPNTTPLIAGSGNVANASAVATLTPSTTTTAYISGFEVTGSGATAGLPVTVTVAGLLGGTRSYTYTFVAGVLVGNTPLIIAYDPPLPASAINTAIVVTCPASGAGGSSSPSVRPVSSPASRRKRSAAAKLPRNTRASSAA